MQIEDIKKLADLARIDMSEEEMTGMAKDFGSILAYVDHIKEASGEIPADKNSEDYRLQNIMREDEVTNKGGGYTEKLLSQAPDTENGFVKVKQIL